jgi:hypothetical protein
MTDVMTIETNTSRCQSCGKEFGCGAKLDGCWCTEVKLADWQAEVIKAEFDNCLCPGCLATFAARRAVRVTYPDGNTEIVEDAVRVDTQNFHEGMFDLYDEKGNLLRQIDMVSGITWENL